MTRDDPATSSADTRAKPYDEKSTYNVYSETVHQSGKLSSFYDAVEGLEIEQNEA